MSRKPDLKAGDVLSFRIPENISSDDLSHLRWIAKRPTSGKTGAINSFFFSKVAEDRIRQSRHVFIDLPELSETQIAKLDSPVFKKAMTIYAYQLLDANVPNIEHTSNENKLIADKNEDTIAMEKGQIQQKKRDDLEDQPDQRVLDLLRKLQD